MIIFHQFFLPDLYYYPTSSNLTKSRAYHQSEILPPPLPGAGMALVRAGKEETPREREGKRRETSPSEQQGRASRRAAALMVMAGPF